MVHTTLCASAITTLLLIGVMTQGCSRPTGDNDNQSRPVQISERVSQTPAGEPLIHLASATQARIGLQTEALIQQSMQPEVVGYGKLEEDPSRSFIVRAPIAGTLHFAAGRDWPSIGQHLAANDVVGMIEPRLVPAEQITITNQLVTARSELSASTASVAAAEAAYERARILNADNKNVSDSTLQDAEAKLRAEEARLQAATENIHLLENSLKSSGPTGNKPLLAERGGDVVEIMAQPGESIEAGSPIIRVADLNRLLVRVDIPPGQHVPPSATAARIYAVGYENAPVVADRVALAAAVDPKSQGESFLFRLRGTLFGLRPGLSVTARIGVPGSKRTGVIIPQSAVVRMAGKSYAYVQVAQDQFVRKEVNIDDPVGGGYFVGANFSPGDRVVVEGAQILLSEEFKSQTAPDEN